jgi:hypothetical protein
MDQLLEQQHRLEWKEQQPHPMDQLLEQQHTLEWKEQPVQLPMDQQQRVQQHMLEQVQ